MNQENENGTSIEDEGSYKYIERILKHTVTVKISAKNRTSLVEM